MNLRASCFHLLTSLMVNFDTMVQEKRTRQRAVQLKPQAAELLNRRAAEVWYSQNPGIRLTREKKADLMGVSVLTLDRILNGGKIDKSSLDIAFGSLQLELSEGYWYRVSSEASSGMSDASGQSRCRAKGQLFSGYLVGCLLAVLAIFAFGFSVYRGSSTFASKWQREFETNFNNGFATYHSGKYAAARVHIDRAVALARNHRDAYNLSKALRLKGEILAVEGDHQHALMYFEDSLACMRGLQEFGWHAAILELIGNTSVRLGRYDEAKEAYNESLVRAKARNNLPEIGAALRGLGAVEAATGDLKRAKSWFHEALDRLGSQEPNMARDILARLALVWCEEGDHNKSLATLHDCLASWRSQLHPRWIARTEYQLAFVYWAKGDRITSRLYLAQALQRFRTVGDRSGIRDCQDLLLKLGSNLGA